MIDKDPESVEFIEEPTVVVGRDAEVVSTSIDEPDVVVAETEVVTSPAIPETVIVRKRK